MIQLLEGIAIGLAIGVFCPAIARKIKALFVKESKVVVADAEKSAVVAAVEKKL
jgi:hypothetical protein